MYGPPVLILSDDLNTGRVWMACMREKPCEPVLTSSISQALAKLETISPALIIIDVTLREINAAHLCMALRDKSQSVLLVITPINNETHTLEVYAAGADECVIKPVSPALFMAKVDVWLHRTLALQSPGNKDLCAGEWTLDVQGRSVNLANGRSVHLSGLELRLLHLLMSHPGQPFTSFKISERVWGLRGEDNTSLVKNLIYRLRKKLEADPRNPCFLLSTPDHGYYIKINS